MSSHHSCLKVTQACEFTEQKRHNLPWLAAVTDFVDNLSRPSSSSTNDMHPSPLTATSLEIGRAISITDIRRLFKQNAATSSSSIMKICSNCPRQSLLHPSCSTQEWTNMMATLFSKEEALICHLTFDGRIGKYSGYLLPASPSMCTLTVYMPFENSDRNVAQLFENPSETMSLISGSTSQDSRPPLSQHCHSNVCNNSKISNGKRSSFPVTVMDQRIASTNSRGAKMVNIARNPLHDTNSISHPHSSASSNPRKRVRKDSFKDELRKQALDIRIEENDEDLQATRDEPSIEEKSDDIKNDETLQVNSVQIEQFGVIGVVSTLITDDKNGSQTKRPTEYYISSPDDENLVDESSRSMTMEFDKEKVDEVDVSAVDDPPKPSSFLSTVMTGLSLFKKIWSSPPLLTNPAENQQTHIMQTDAIVELASAEVSAYDLPEAHETILFKSLKYMKYKEEIDQLAKSDEPERNPYAMRLITVIKSLKKDLRVILTRCLLSHSINAYQASEYIQDILRNSTDMDQSLAHMEKKVIHSLVDFVRAKGSNHPNYLCDMIASYIIVVIVTGQGGGSSAGKYKEKALIKITEKVALTMLINKTVTKDQMTWLGLPCQDDHDLQEVTIRGLINYLAARGFTVHDTVLSTYTSQNDEDPQDEETVTETEPAYRLQSKKDIVDGTRVFPFRVAVDDSETTMEGSDDSNPSLSTAAPSIPNNDSSSLSKKIKTSRILLSHRNLKFNQAPKKQVLVKPPMFQPVKKTNVPSDLGRNIFDSNRLKLRPSRPPVPTGFGHVLKRHHSESDKFENKRVMHMSRVDSPWKSPRMPSRSVVEDTPLSKQGAPGINFLSIPLHLFAAEGAVQSSSNLFRVGSSVENVDKLSGKVRRLSTTPIPHHNVHDYLDEKMNS